MCQKISYISKSANETKQFASKFTKELPAGAVVCLDGDLGAGKTQFVQGAALYLGVKEDVVSPTFNLLLEYHSGSLPLYHFDLYRFDNIEQLEDIAFYEVIESGGLSFIEWANKFPQAIPNDAISIYIKKLDENKREFIILKAPNNLNL